MDKFSIFNFQSPFQKGFSLIEILVVFAIIGVTMVTSIAAFFTYNKSQSSVSAISNVVQELNLARSRARSQVKPPVCAGKSLKYYQVYIIAPGSTYRLKVMCDTTLTTIETKTLPTGVTFTDASPLSINFFAYTGITTKSQIVHITGASGATTITVSQTGVISSP